MRTKASTTCTLRSTPRSETDQSLKLVLLHVFIYFSGLFCSFEISLFFFQFRFMDIQINEDLTMGTPVVQDEPHKIHIVWGKTY